MSHLMLVQKGTREVWQVPKSNPDSFLLPCPTSWYMVP